MPGHNGLTIFRITNDMGRVVVAKLVIPISLVIAGPVNSLPTSIGVAASTI